jgi:hypothetical protein
MLLIVHLLAENVRRGGIEGRRLSQILSNLANCFFTVTELDMKDFVLLAVSIYLLKQDVVRVCASGRDRAMPLGTERAAAN